MYAYRNNSGTFALLLRLYFQFVSEFLMFCYKQARWRNKDLQQNRRLCHVVMVITKLSSYLKENKSVTITNCRYLMLFR
jgi:hypothetical protein